MFLLCVYLGFCLYLICYKRFTLRSWIELELIEKAWSKVICRFVVELKRNWTLLWHSQGIGELLGMVWDLLWYVVVFYFNQSIVDMLITWTKNSWILFVGKKRIKNLDSGLVPKEMWLQSFWLDWNLLCSCCRSHPLQKGATPGLCVQVLY